MTKTLAATLVAALAALVACGGDDPATFKINGREWEVDCDDLDQFADQWARYDETEDESQAVFTAWQDECGEDWVMEAFDRILYGPDGEG